ncbi:MAG: site-2 protease family protein [Candidatus Thorarchaeota archaeon]
MAIDDDQTTSVISYPTFAELNDILTQHFQIVMSVLEFGMPTFVVRWPEGGVMPSNEAQDLIFKELTEQIKPLKVWPMVRWRNKAEGEYFIRFVPIQKPGKSNKKINYALFVTTLATMAIAGILQATSPVFQTLFYPGGFSILDLLFVVITFMMALMGIIFTHEMGHYKMAQRKGIAATLPYFIPGLPQIGGTFGAFIQQKSPPHNREELIDLGLAGPLAGFAVTLVVLFLGYAMSVPVTAQQLIAIEEAFPGMSGELGVPLLFTWVGYLFIDYVPVGGTLYMHPVAFAAWVGLLVTSLNLFPISQLDGGHALRAIVGPKYHKQIGWIALMLMVLAGYFTMAILILVMSGGGGHPGPLNDTVKISKWRMVLFGLSMIILVLSIPPLWNMLGIF